jgi:aquaporin Z
MSINGRISWTEFFGYVLAQLLGAIAGAAILFGIIYSTGANPYRTGLGQNGFAGTISLLGALVVEAILTFVFVIVILSVTGKNSSAGKKGGIVIGLTLTLVHLLGIRLTGTSVNPARSFGPALILLGNPIKDVWVFFVAPLVGGFFAAIFGKHVLGTD